MTNKRPTQPCPNCDGTSFETEKRDLALIVRTDKTIELNRAMVVNAFTCKTCGLVQLYREP